MGRLVDIDQTSLAECRIGALPIVNAFLARLGLIDPERRREKVADWIRALDIRVTDSSVAVQTLSGGNQQRVVIAKWLASGPKILILDGPTVGIDVMAKSAIHGIMRELARKGMGVLLISDEVAEVVANCNRILLMRSGRIRAQIVAEGVEPGELQRMVEAGA